MQLMQKIGRMFVRQPGKRGLSRVDLVIFLALGVVAVVDLVFHTSQPSSLTATASPVKLASRQGVATTSGADQVALPDTRQSPASSSGASASPYSFPSCYRSVSANGGGIGALPNAPNTISGPFGSSDLLFFVTCPGLTTESSSIPTPTLWRWMLLIVDAAVIVLFVLTGLRIMMGGSIFRYANAIEVLPRILLALLAANLSLSIVSMSLELNNDLVVQIYNQANNLAPTTAQFWDGNDIVTKTCNNWWTGGGAAGGAVVGSAGGPIGSIVGGIIGGFLGHMIGCDVDPHVTDWNDKLSQSLQPENITGGASFTGMSLLFKTMSDLLGFITGILALTLMGQMIVRLLLLNFYIILAPLGIGASALPGRVGQNVTGMWLQGFFTTLFAQFLQVVGLIVIRLLIGAITSGVYASLLAAFNNNSAVNNDATLLWVIQIAQFWFLIRIPALLGSSATNMMISFGQTVSQLTQTAVTMAAMEVQFISSAALSVLGSAASLGVAAVAR